MVTHLGLSTHLYRIAREVQYHMKVQFKNFHLMLLLLSAV